MASENAVTGLAERYANAVFELAQEQQAIDGLSADLTALRRAIEVSPELARLVKSPLFGRDTQVRALTALLERMGVSQLTINLVSILAGKRRLFALTGVIAAYERLVARSRGETEAEVTAARSLTDGEIAELKAVLKSRLGKEPRLHAKVDPSLLGGLIVKLGSRMIDSSIRTKLTGLAAAMKGN